MKKIIDGKETEVIEIETVLVKEPWNEYTFSNGDLLKVRYVATGIYKDTNSNPADPHFSVDFKPVLRFDKVEKKK